MDHFTKFVNDRKEIKAKCNYCDKELFCDPYKNRTTSLRAHMNSCKTTLMRLKRLNYK
ncbi:hypothetical protein F511_01887 [Dorcoceras hygrometricum]|uniref:BED-type domain-containing protein n=1 Tax=Dorcoceras hygrometricum TaxID=472368 RepID=A0A2Z7CXM0_9LAMI|nr:hypothetical protein F511_01887 [Dorcoceras hygrometricum]